LIAEWDSPSLAELLRDTNKYSNNVMARHLLLLLGTREAGAGSTPQLGVHAVQQWLSQHDLPATSLVLENGAGLSDLERISARELGKILIHGWRSAWMPELLASLPVVGLDGTMRNRLKQGSASGQAHIKTGTLHNVRSIAGYVRGQSGKMYVVVSMINHERASHGQKVHDALIQWLVDKG
jgi:D-alanyl-D-alanine carboxypeptidase/D-alanyl-D-alanine-endopeptidase (penicillin-binding protein 4)